MKALCILRKMSDFDMSQEKFFFCCKQNLALETILTGAYATATADVGSPLSRERVYDS